MNYFEFKADYIETLEQFLTVKEKRYNGLIYGPQQAELARKLCDMEEAQPAWVERIEDGLACYHPVPILQDVERAEAHLTDDRGW